MLSSAEAIMLGRKKRGLEKKAQLYMRELLMSKVIGDFKLKFQLVCGVTSSASAREVTHSLLPFLLEMHAALPSRLTRALAQVIHKNTSQLPATLPSPEKSLRQPGGFLVVDKDPLDIVEYYRGILFE